VKRSHNTVAAGDRLSITKTPFEDFSVSLSAYVSFKGECEAAFKFYEEALGAKPGLLFRYTDSPMADAVPAGWDSKIMHGSITIAGQLLEGADAPPDRYDEPKGFSLSLNVPTAEEAERLFEQLAVDGRVRYAIGKTFWSERFGMVIDRFGIPWMINCENRG
jgi:PhnB protein